MLTNNLKIQQNIDLFWKISIFSFLAVLCFTMPNIGYASATSMSGVLCTILQGLTGAPAKIIATFAICFLGIAAFFGKLQWGTALLVGVGIALIFGATAIVNAVAGTSTCATGGGTSF